MHVDGDTIQAMIPDPATGDESMAAVALLIMDDTLDLMKTTGWYWCRVDVHGPPKDHQTWVQAVREARGPVRSPDLAFQAAQGANIPAMDAAIRLSDAAEAVRTGLIAPDLESITMYVSTSLEQDQSPPGRVRRPQPDRRRPPHRGQPAGRRGPAPGARSLRGRPLP